MDDLLEANIHEDDFDEESIEHLYKVLIELNLNNIRGENQLKILEIAIFLLKNKGEQVKLLQEQSDTKSYGEARDEPSLQRIYDDNERLNRIAEKLESEKISLKAKIKDMGDEITMLQKRIHEMASNESDKDSQDALSELDRREELLKNISTKNKHIKKLIREIEKLQIQNIEQSKKIIELDNTIKVGKSYEIDLQSQLDANESKNKEIIKTINELRLEIQALESNITYLEDEREKSDLELKEFLQKLEEKAKSWRKIIDQKESQLDSLRKKYEILSKSENFIAMNSSGSDQENEMQNLLQAIHERDSLIDELESKLKAMAEEMMISTRLMNEISKERESEKYSRSEKISLSSQKCEEKLKKRCTELSELLDKSEEDNLLKAKLANDALKTLQAYENGEDGLPQALRQISHLEQKLSSRNKQIKALVMELNSLHEISQENSILRKKLNIPDDMIISTNNLAAKQRSKDKMIDRLNLKLRASEEIRLQLKIDKSDLKKEILELQEKLRKYGEQEFSLGIQSSVSETECGECGGCIENNQILKDLEIKYSSVIEENENLRAGMHEILEKIREYDVSSDHITIDCSVLEKVLHALDARSISGWYHPAMRMQNELIAVKEREMALKEKILLVEKNFSDNKRPTTSVNLRTKEEKKINSTRSVASSSSSSTSSVPTYKTYDKAKPVPQIRKNSYTIKVHSDEEKPQIESKDIQRNSILEKEELIVYKQKYLALIEDLKMNNESGIEQTSGDLIEKITNLEIQLSSQVKTLEFLKEDYDETLTQQKANEIKNISLTADLKKQLNTKKHELMKNSQRLKKIEKNSKNNEENMDFKEKYLKLESKLANLIKIIFNGNKTPELEMDNDFLNVGIINENLTLEFITVEEFNNIKNINKQLEDELNDLRNSYLKLQETHENNLEEMNSKHKLLLEITDNHIDLRHLVADLKSTSEEKFLITKLRKELNDAKLEQSKIKKENDDLFKVISKLNESKIEEKYEKLLKDINFEHKNNEIKLDFLKKYVFNMQEKYSKYVPLITLADFVSSYKKYLIKMADSNEIDYEKVEDLVNSKLKSFEINESENLLKLVKSEVKCDYLESQLKNSNNKLDQMQQELNEIKLCSIEDNEQNKMIQALFGEKIDKTDIEYEKSIKSTQTEQILEKKSVAINTVDSYTENQKKTVRNEKKFSIKGNSEKDDEKIIEKEIIIDGTQIIEPECISNKKLLISGSDVNFSSESSKKEPSSLEILTLENQLKQAMNLASKRSVLLLETENKLAETNGQIKEMEKLIKNLKENSNFEINPKIENKTDLLETNFQSMHAVIAEKDTSLKHYQELLRAEREQHLKSCETYDKEAAMLKKNLNDIEYELNSKDTEILELKVKMNGKKSKEQLPPTQSVEDSDNEFDGNYDNNQLSEISDEKLEEMFMDESKNFTPKSDQESPSKISMKSFQFKEYKNREHFWENIVRSKDEEITQIKEKLHDINRKNDINENHEIEQLRILLEDKDKHINDLMETLTNFHEDQQRFLSETSTSIYSADQLSELGISLTRSENTNKILQTQIEALKRQLNTISHREKQARDLANSLKNQLIKRPVIPIKTDLGSKSKIDQIQKRVQQLEAELEDSRKEIQKQKLIIEAKRAKNASEVTLWEKLKRETCRAEKLKTKLEENEKSLEKTRALLNAARTTINRLERVKNIEPKSKVLQCCRVPSCPNFQEDASERSHLSSSSGSENQVERRHHRSVFNLEYNPMVFNLTAVELEKLHERMSEIESRNIRLEAKNLQLQLDNDLLRQGDENDRMRKRIKHLEDYILALKEELAKHEAEQQLSIPNPPKKTSIVNQEQTILALKRIVERLKVENKNLKEGRNTGISWSSNGKIQELARLQQLYTDALNKIAALQVELQLKNNSTDSSSKEGGNDNELIKAQLIQKTQLLEKAKMLLTRAAAKEKALKDQLAMWKRKCFELQNVPVIEEISE